MSNQIRIITPSETVTAADKWRVRFEKGLAAVKLIFRGRKLSKRNIVDAYSSLPVRKKTILVLGLGCNVRGSMQYVLNELNSSPEFKGYKIYVRTKDNTYDIVRGYIRQNGWNRTTAFRKGYRTFMESAEYLITESYFPYQWIPKTEQKLIDLWHGTPLKCIGVIKNGNKAHLQAIQQKNFLRSDYCLYPNEFTREVMERSFQIAPLMKAKALMLGYPRTAGLLMVTEERQREIRQQLAPNDEKLFAYMPTFRGYLSDEDSVDRERKLLEYLDARLTDGQILLVNLHHRIGKALDCSSFRHIRNFPPLIDSYELLTATDALITDYSSVFFDYLVLGKQIILYMEDFDTYRSYQGLNMDLAELPFDLAYSLDEIITFLNRGKDYDDTEIRNRLCAFDSAENARKLCRVFTGSTEGLDIVPPVANGKKKVLFFSEDCRPGRQTEFLHSFVRNRDPEACDFWVGCDTNRTSENLDSAYPMLHETSVIASDVKFELSSVGEPLRKAVIDGAVSFEKAIRYLRNE
ncbi:MAG: CDP-glycerol glycerophosphotransferase family protein, partial [Erysipelotrichaceae bacterium]|nr:CDP-glycerol glycerophosphotransferase family protein [Erysipelotrichaceae bacterium]